MINVKDYETRLTTLRDELLHRQQAIENDTHHRNEPVEKDFAEQATQSENDDVLNALDNETKITLSAIDAALIRIADGQFGLCSKCGEAINEKRLQAIPYATTCINCAE